MEELWCDKVDREAGEKLAALLALPMPENSDMLGIEGEFCPWELFPSLYGSYSSEFDELAIEVLCNIRDGWKPDQRNDLAAEMFREMLCTAHLCDYGTSPRSCSPTTRFGELLPALIEKWTAYSRLAWGDEMKS